MQEQSSDSQKPRGDQPKQNPPTPEQQSEDRQKQEDFASRESLPPKPPHRPESRPQTSSPAGTPPPKHDIPKQADQQKPQSDGSSHMPPGKLPTPPLRPAPQPTPPPPPKPPFAREQLPEQQLPNRETKPYSPEQKRKFLKREEIKTMQKDIVRLREDEAQKEQERITRLQEQQKQEREKEIIHKIRASALEQKKQEEVHRRENLQKIQDSILPPGEETRIQNLPTPPSRSKKVGVRIFTVLILALIVFNIALFGYWYFFVRDGGAQTPPPPEVPTAPPPPASPVPPAIPPPEVPIQSAAFFPAQHTTTLQFSDKDNLIDLLAQFTKEQRDAGFTEILFYYKSLDLKIQQGKNFLEFLQVPVPELTSSHLADDSFFFLYSTEQGNRFGLITPTQNEEQAVDALKQWETTIEQDLTPLLPFWGEPGEGYTDTFRSTAHQNVEIRFQTFSTQDRGIVYAIVNNYLILSSSFEGIKAVIDELVKPSASAPIPKTLASLEDPELFKPPERLTQDQAIGQVLFIGFKDATLTPQLEQLIKRLQPGGVLLLSRNIQSIDQLRKLTEDLQRVSLQYSSLPLFIAVDQEGGAISRIEFGKEKTAQSDIQSTSQAYDIGQDRSEELKYLGINLNLSPVLDKASSSDFIFDRTFQTDSLRAGRLAQALLSGQESTGILSALKHFPGYGNISFNPEKTLATVQEFPDISPFVFALSAQPDFLLLSNVIYPTVDPNKPFTFSSTGISLINSDLNFNGLILSDDLAQPALLDNYSLKNITVSPLVAGVHMIMLSDEAYAQDSYDILVKEVQQNSQLKDTIENSAAQILELKRNFFLPETSPLQTDHLSQNN